MVWRLEALASLSPILHEVAITNVVEHLPERSGPRPLRNVGQSQIEQSAVDFLTAAVAPERKTSILRAWSLADEEATHGSLRWGNSAGTKVRPVSWRPVTSMSRLPMPELSLTLLLTSGIPATFAKLTLCRLGRSAAA